jgi:hypothetical protein
MIEVCRWALSRLPGYASAAPAARRAAARIVAFQCLSLGRPGELEAWAVREASPGSGFAWFEAAAAAGSSLPVHALIAASMSPELSSHEVVAIERAYSSVIGALHSLLDSVVDEAEDAATPPAMQSPACAALPSAPWASLTSCPRAARTRCSVRR